MVEENKKVNWIPESIGTGRFGNWLEGARDWAISRSRYWGAPFPVWECDKCGKTEVVGSIEELSQKLPQSGNTYLAMRHGQSESNEQNCINSDPEKNDPLTLLGKKQTKESAEKLKEEKIDLIIASSFVRAKETAEIVAETLGIDKGKIVYDNRLWEIKAGDLDKKSPELLRDYFDYNSDKFNTSFPGGEKAEDARKRAVEFLYEIDKKYQNKKILIVTHGHISRLLVVANEDFEKVSREWGEGKVGFGNAEVKKINFVPVPHNRNYEVDLHRPYIDEVVYPCQCGGEMKRVKDVFDCWFESGSMPYAQLHYPFENKKEIDEGKNFPADFIAEGLDQTRGWFYSLLVLSVGLFEKTPYKNVIVNGIILAEDGQKMSKSLKNYPDPMEVAEKYGADALRYYLLSSPAVHADSLCFSEKGVEEVYRKVIARLLNVLSFYQTYEEKNGEKVAAKDSNNILDQWILVRLNELGREVSKGFDSYQLDRATRPIGDFVDDLSTWYLRRSRERFKGDDQKDKNYALATTQYVLAELSKIIAPVMPFVAEYIYGEVSGKEKSVHLTDWSEYGEVDEEVLNSMTFVRSLVTVALMQRAEKGIKVRQPLLKITIKQTGKEPERWNEYAEILKDEINVKEIVLDSKADFDTSILLDIKITPELIQEGQLRELVRNIQQLRKKTELTPNDRVVAVFDTDDQGRSFVEKFAEELKKTTLLKDITFKKLEGDTEIIIDELKFKVSLEK